MSRFETTANVILTFDGQDEEGNSQEFYDAGIDAAYPEGDADLQRFEVEVIKDVLAAGRRSQDDLVKISLCYDSTPPQDVGLHAQHEHALEHLCRNSAKYYFQPNQRDDYEQAIVDALGIASKTRDLG